MNGGGIRIYKIRLVCFQLHTINLISLIIFDPSHFGYI